MGGQVDQRRGLAAAVGYGAAADAWAAAVGLESGPDLLGVGAHVVLPIGV